MYAYLILTLFSQITALFGTTRLFIFDKNSLLHDYLGIHDFGFGDNPSYTIIWACTILVWEPILPALHTLITFWITRQFCHNWIWCIIFWDIANSQSIRIFFSTISAVQYSPALWDMPCNLRHISIICHLMSQDLTQGSITTVFIEQLSRNSFLPKWERSSKNFQMRFSKLYFAHFDSTTVRGSASL